MLAKNRKAGLRPAKGLKGSIDHESADGADAALVALVVVVLVAIVEVLFPRVVVIVLGRTPIVGTSKTANRKNKGVHINTRHLIFIVVLLKNELLHIK